MAATRAKAQTIREEVLQLASRPQGVCRGEVETLTTIGSASYWLRRLVREGLLSVSREVRPRKRGKLNGKEGISVVYINTPVLIYKHKFNIGHPTNS